MGGENISDLTWWGGGTGGGVVFVTELAMRKDYTRCVSLTPFHLSMWEESEEFRRGGALEGY